MIRSDFLLLHSVPLKGSISYEIMREQTKIHIASSNQHPQKSSYFIGVKLLSASAGVSDPQEGEAQGSPSELEALVWGPSSSVERIHGTGSWNRFPVLPVTRSYFFQRQPLLFFKIIPRTTCHIPAFCTAKLWLQEEKRVLMVGYCGYKVREVTEEWIKLN